MTPEKMKLSISKSFEIFWEMEMMGLSDEEIIQESKSTLYERKCRWLCDDVFRVITYDTDLSKTFGDIIYKVLRSIYKKEWNYNIIGYEKYIIVCNLLNMHKLIGWGTSIRCPWFEYNNVDLTIYVHINKGYEDVKVNEDVIKYLIDEFMEWDGHIGSPGLMQ